MSKSSSAKKAEKNMRDGYSTKHVGKNTIVVVRPVSRDVMETTVRIIARDEDDLETATVAASDETAATQ